MCLMHQNLKTTLKYLGEVDTLDELEVDTLKLKHGIKLSIKLCIQSTTKV